jgi:regulatory protein
LRRVSRPEKRPAGPQPTEARLREAALRHLERHAATSATLSRVLANRVRRWVLASTLDDEAKAEAAATARAAIPKVVAALVQARALDDAAFAESRARRLARAGGSRRRIAAHLAARGVALATETDEFAAALAFARRRRLPPFGQPFADAPGRLKALAALARAGFSRDIAERVLRADLDEAEARLRALAGG